MTTRLKYKERRWKAVENPIIFGFDVIHGYKTIFPIPLAQAATWDLDLIERIERIAATEAERPMDKTGPSRLW
ncbi:MAG: hypothetical protein R2778_04280 [Saprospiraceae bacterium]